MMILFGVSILILQITMAYYAKGKKYWILAGITVAVTLGSMIYGEWVESENDEQRLTEMYIRDSTQKWRYDSALLVIKDSTINVVSTALGRYGYILDTTQTRLIELIRDSAKTKVILSNDPVLIIEGITEREQDGNVLFDIHFKSSDAPAAMLRISALFLFKTNHLSNDLTVAGEYRNMIASTAPIPSNISRAVTFNPDNPNAEACRKYRILFMCLKGSYSNTNKSKKIVIDEVYYVNRNDIAKITKFSDNDTPMKIQVRRYVKEQCPWFDKLSE